MLFPLMLLSVLPSLYSPACTVSAFVMMPFLRLPRYTTVNYANRFTTISSDTSVIVVFKNEKGEIIREKVFDFSVRNMMVASEKAAGPTHARSWKNLQIDYKFTENPLPRRSPRERGQHPVQAVFLERSDRITLEKVYSRRLDPTFFHQFTGGYSQVEKVQIDEQIIDCEKVTFDLKSSIGFLYETKKNTPTLKMNVNVKMGEEQQTKTAQEIKVLDRQYAKPVVYQGQSPQPNRPGSFKTSTEKQIQDAFYTSAKSQVPSKVQYATQTIENPKSVPGLLFTQLPGNVVQTSQKLGVDKKIPQNRSIDQRPVDRLQTSQKQDSKKAVSNRPVNSRPSGNRPVNQRPVNRSQSAQSRENQRSINKRPINRRSTNPGQPSQRRELGNRMKALHNESTKKIIL